AAGTYDTTVTPGTISTPGIATPAPAAGAAPALGAATAGAVGAFTQFVSAGTTTSDESGLQQYAAGGVSRLARALSGAGASGADIDNMRKQADALQGTTHTPTNPGHMARSAFLSAAQAFSALKSADAAKIHSAASAVSAGPHLLNQKDKIQSFFDAA